MASLVSTAEALTYNIGDNLPDRIHYACGHNVMQGWANTDYFDEHSYPDGVVPEDLTGIIYHVDLGDRHPFPDDSFSYAYSEDFIEHLPLMQAITFLFEARRCLKPGGVMRVSTPGFLEVMQRHYAGKAFENLAHEHVDVFTAWGHHQFFSHQTLEAAAMAAGFKHYRVCEYGESEHAPLRGIDTRFRQIGLNIIAELTA